MSRVAPHPYVGDGLADHRGDARCRLAGCGLPERNRCHVLPPGVPDARQAAAGDKDERERENLA